MERDYSEQEISHMIQELTDIHMAKLKEEEISFLVEMSLRTEPLEPYERDLLIKMYEGMGEAGYG